MIWPKKTAFRLNRAKLPSCKYPHPLQASHKRSENSGCLRIFSLEHTKGGGTSDRREIAKGGLPRDEAHDFGSDGERVDADWQRFARIGLA